MNRRSFLKATTTVGISSALAGCGMGGFSAGDTGSDNTGNATNETQNRTVGLPAPVSDPNQYASGFTNVVNMVEAGADPTGNEDVSPVIQREIGSDTLLVFPQGTYKMNSQVRRVGLRNLGIIGQGAVLRHGTVEAIDGFEVTNGEFTGPAQHFKIGIPDNPHKGKFVFGGFIADWRRPNSGIQILNHHTDGTSVIENVRQQGIHSLGCQGPFRVDCHGPESNAIVRGVDLRFGGKSYQFTINTRDERSGGGTEKGRSWATSGITTHPEAKGHLRVQQCMCGGWPDNGFYLAGGPEQTVEILNCVAANSHPSNIRISGTDCRIAGCTVVTDSNFEKTDFYFEQRPIRLDGGSCTVENVRIKQLLPTGWSVTVQHAMEQATLNNIHIEIHKQPQLALVVDDAVNQCTVNGFAVRTEGWRGTRGALFRGWPDVAKNISVNGRSVA
ncbi:hypothetical protein SAMN05421858_4605 [Haladaptatus litoreus]|uniref:Tat (Twin-arginine translocation) pathway signal sequence n=1 Tax=Haladaptatus litoreus TaxID=553468 RepID=A0A1N7EXK0_9EURY|nr:twin-arginine translocation signal domain-containing protein [Haladaptatus litoreus]SIR92790.1 hypothetical protein SAMN05421858_4605 [Haladaptatus litoreus]